MLRVPHRPRPAPRRCWRAPARPGRRSRRSRTPACAFQPIWPATNTCRPSATHAVGEALGARPVSCGWSESAWATLRLELEALDLAGLRLGQGVDELDRARILVGRDRRLDVVLQALGAGVVAGHARASAPRAPRRSGRAPRRARRPRRTRRRPGARAAPPPPPGPAML